MKECAIAIECADHVAAVGMATHDNAETMDLGKGSPVPRLMSVMSHPWQRELCSISQMSVWGCRPQLWPESPSVSQGHENAFRQKRCFIAAQGLSISTQEGSV